MTAFRVTPAELMGLSQQVHGTAGSIESELAGLRSRVLTDQRHLDRPGPGPLPGPVRRVEPQRAGPAAGPGRHQPAARAGRAVLRRGRAPDRRELRGSLTGPSWPCDADDRRKRFRHDRARGSARPRHCGRLGPDLLRAAHARPRASRGLEEALAHGGRVGDRGRSAAPAAAGRARHSPGRGGHGAAALGPLYARAVEQSVVRNVVDDAHRPAAPWSSPTGRPARLPVELARTVRGAVPPPVRRTRRWRRGAGAAPVPAGTPSGPG